MRYEVSQKKNFIFLNKPHVAYIKIFKYVEPVFSNICDVLGPLSHGSAPLLSHLKQEYKGLHEKCFKGICKGLI